MARIALISADLGSNAVLRCLAYAHALKGHHEATVIGPLMDGAALWAPLAGQDVDIRAVRGPGYWPGFIGTARRMLRAIDADLMIVSQPAPTNYGVALLKRRLSGVPIALDISDDAVAQAKVFTWKRSPNYRPISNWLHGRSNRADAIFCCSEVFRSRYGGILVPHGNDPAVFDPTRYDRDTVRGELGLDPADTLIGFIGTPLPAKGLHTVIEALERIDDPSLKLMIVGAAHYNNYAQELEAAHPERVILFPMQPLDKAPYFLSAIDIVVLPQAVADVNEGQVPAKLTDAMAMTKPVIGAAISDIPRILDGCGLTFKPDDATELVERIKQITGDPAAAREMGARARQRFLEEMTYDAVFAAIEPTIERLISARR